MSFLMDKEISNAVASTPPLATDVDAQKYASKSDPIQACSLDLSIGEIFVPDVDADKPGGTNKPLKGLSLAQGATAVIRTREKLTMPPHLGGIAFPPSQVSIDGLLMTNPGHVDPGYEGQLHLTVINMGSKPYGLRRGDRIVRVLLFRLSPAPAHDYQVRHPGPKSSAITEELLSQLSGDFMDVTKRADESAKKQISAAQLGISIRVPIVAAAIGALITFAGNMLTNSQVKDVDRKVDALNARVDSLGGNVDLGKIQAQINELKKKVGH
jgi:deoxycytidine triphosphate deaminase